MTTISLTSKGQLTLPVEVRRALNLKKSDKLELSYNPETQKVTITKPMSLQELSTMASSYIKKGQHPLKNVDEYYQAHRGNHL